MRAGGNTMKEPRATGWIKSPKCPYCGALDRDADMEVDNDGATACRTCKACGQEFELASRITVLWQSYPDPCAAAKARK